MIEYRELAEGLEVALNYDHATLRSSKDKRDEIFEKIKIHVANFPSLHATSDIAHFIYARYADAGMLMYGVAARYIAVGGWYKVGTFL